MKSFSRYRFFDGEKMLAQLESRNSPLAYISRIPISLSSTVENRDAKNNNNSNISKYLMGASGIVSQVATTPLITTASGYTMSPLTITMISNAPLLAFSLVQLSGLAPIRQIMKEGKTGELSPFPFVSLYTNCAIWELYGILNNDPTIKVANLAGVVLGLAYTAIYSRYTQQSMMPYYLGSSSLLAVMLTSPFWLSTENSIQLLGSFGCASAVVLMASPLTVVKTVIEQRSTESMPFIVSLAMTLNGVSWFTYGWFVANDAYIWVPNALGSIAGFIQLSLFGIYRSPKK